MRFITTLILGTALALPAMAQTTHTTPHKAKPHATMSRAAKTGTPNRPTENDKGPFTPEANRAYEGGGAVLTGQPGGPPPPASAATTMPAR